MLLSILGISVILAAAVTVCAKYSAYERKRLSECEGFLLLLRHIRAGISCFCMPIPECVRGFENRALSDAGFIDALLESESFSEAVEKCEGRLSLGEGELHLLRSLGDSLGKNFKEEELRLLDYYEEELTDHINEEEGKMPGREKLCRTLVITGAFAAVILFI